MPKVTIPLILPATARGWATSIGTSAKDQQLINGLYQVSKNPQAGSKTVYTQKRPGSTTGGSIVSGVRILANFGGVGAYFSNISDLFWADVGGGVGRIYDTTGQSLGDIDGAISPESNYIVADSIISVSGGCYAFTSTGNNGYFLYNDALDSATFPTFSGNRTSGSAVISGIADTTGAYKGQLISGTGIPAATRILSVDSGTQITMSANATSGAGTATTITKEAIAEITDAQFPTNETIKNMVAMDGYFFVGTRKGNIYQSAINDPAEWASSDVINADYVGDGINCIGKIGNYIVSFGSAGSIQYFYNAGNASGSVLSAAEHLNVTGIILDAAPFPFGGRHYCIARLGASSSSSDGQMGLYRINGASQFERVSDDIVGAIIQDQALSIVGQIELGGKNLVAMINGSDTDVLVYDEATNMFSVLSMGAAINSAFKSTFTKAATATKFSWATGNTWTDSSSAYTLTAQTEPKVFNKGSPFIIKSVDLIADIEASGTATLYVSRDDGATWESVGTFDMTAQRKRIHALGWFHASAAFKVEHSANTNFRAQAVVADIEPCR